MWIFSKFKIYIAIAAAAIGTIIMAFMKGASSERDKHKAQQGKNYMDTRKRIDDATADLPDDADAIRERMQQRINDRKG